MGVFCSVSIKTKTYKFPHSLNGGIVPYVNTVKRHIVSAARFCHIKSFSIIIGLTEPISLQKVAYFSLKPISSVVGENDTQTQASS